MTPDGFCSCCCWRCCFCADRGGGRGKYVIDSVEETNNEGFSCNKATASLLSWLINDTETPLALTVSFFVEGLLRFTFFTLDTRPMAADSSVGPCDNRGLFTGLVPPC